MIDYSFSYGDLEIFLLVFVRITSFIFVCPFFGGRQSPNLVKIGFGLLLSILIYGAVPVVPPDYHTLIGYTVIVLKEVMAGFLLGYAVQLSTLIVNFAGTIVDMQIGLSMVNLFDPNTNEQSTITGTFYSQVLTMMLILSGMYHFILKALADSFTLIPVNGVVINSDRMLNAVTAFLRDYIVIGFRIALPIFIITFIANVVLGILAKVSPQMNMFSVGIQIKILAGLCVLYVMIFLFPEICNYIFQQMSTMMRNVVEGMY